jgi:hypothetical protein
MFTPTIVTALYDIQRSSKGDGRTMEEYFNWLEKTLSLNTRFIIFIQDTLCEQLEHFITKNNTLASRLIIKKTKINEIPYYKYKTQMDNILTNTEYKNKIKDSERIECKLAMYNIIQYSKLEWIRIAIEENPHKSTHFFWMDAGCSRFFNTVDLTKEWPNMNNSLINSKITIQGRSDLYYYAGWDTLYLNSTNLLYGTMFGGDKDNMLWLADMIRNVFEQLLNINIINNEQIALALIWKKFPERFNIYINNSSMHLPLFTMLSI